MARAASVVAVPTSETARLDGQDWNVDCETLSILTWPAVPAEAIDVGVNLQRAGTRLRESHYATHIDIR